MTAGRFDRLLRWYPVDWRARYGDELVTLMEDTYGPDANPPVRARLGVVRAGMAEHVHELAGGHEPAPGDRSRAGALLVLCGWAFFVVAGAAYAKLAEHWDVATPRVARWLPAGSYDTVQWGAGIGALAVAAGVAAVLPSLVRLLRSGGWVQIRRPVLRAVITSSVTAAVTVGLVLWAHRSGTGDGNGASPLGHAIGIAWAVSVLATIAVITMSARAVVRRLALPSAVLRMLGYLAIILTLAMAAILVGMLVWWAALAGDSSRFLTGGESGLFSTPATLTMTLSGILMAVGLGVACWGSSLIVGSGTRRRVL
jgi:hypothetical protein